MRWLEPMLKVRGVNQFRRSVLWLPHVHTTPTPPSYLYTTVINEQRLHTHLFSPWSQWCLYYRARNLSPKVSAEQACRQVVRLYLRESLPAWYPQKPSALRQGCQFSPLTLVGRVVPPGLPSWFLAPLCRDPSLFVPSRPGSCVFRCSHVTLSLIEDLNSILRLVLGFVMMVGFEEAHTYFSGLISTVFTHPQTENSDRERDVYEELLTQAEIQGNVNKVNSKYCPKLEM